MLAGSLKMGTLGMGRVGEAEIVRARARARIREKKVVVRMVVVCVVRCAADRLENLAVSVGEKG